MKIHYIILLLNLESSSNIDGLDCVRSQAHASSQKEAGTKISELDMQRFREFLRLELMPKSEVKHCPKCVVAEFSI